jgi:PKD repeat protein
VGRPAAIPANAKVGVFAFNNAATTTPTADFDWFKLEGPAGPAGPSRDDDFSGDTLDKSRWNAIVRENPAKYTVGSGQLTLTLEPGDIYTTDTNPPPGNFILQSADHAGADWVIETKLSGNLSDGYGQGGLIAYGDGDNYVKLDLISDQGQSTINRIEFRSEVGGAIQNPQPELNPLPTGTTNVWLRISKTGTTYKGEYSFDGTAWTAFATVENPVASPAFGLFGFAPQAVAVDDSVSFDYFTLDGQDAPGGGCDCTGPGDELDGPLDTSKWNAIVRPDDTKLAFQEGSLNVTTVLGDLYTNSDPSGTRNLLLQTADHIGSEDYVLETKVDVSQLNGGYAQGGILVYTDDDNYVKFDAISDVDNPKFNRIELRSEQAGAILNPQPQVTTGFPEVVNDVWLRLTKTGTSYAGEYSLDGTTWTALADPVANTQTNAKFGLFTLGVQIADRVVGFEYFKVNGSTGCPPQEPDNQPPVISEATATPQSGFAPLNVKFEATASDEDEDNLSYSWDFGDGGTSNAEDPSHTYTEAGTYEAEVTVSDGTDERTRKVTVTVFGPSDPNARFRALVFSRTTGFRHDSIPAGIAAIKKLGTDHNFQVDATEDPSIFNDDALAHYDVVVFLSTTGDPLNDTQQAAFERYIRKGGGYAGIHAAADTEYTWTWYGKLVGAYFRNHPAGTPEADVLVEDLDHHSTKTLPARWHRTDEWYNYQRPEGAVVGGGGDDWSPREAGVHVLIKMDESTYGEDDGNTTDDDHPISWCQRYDGGRSFYTGMGHTQASFSEPLYLDHLLGGLEVAAGVVPDDDCGNGPANHAPTVSAQRNPGGDVQPGDPVAFTATGTDADDDTLTYSWDFGDGGTATTQDAMHTYTELGVYYAKVTVSDGKGGTASELLKVTVTPLAGDNTQEVGVGGVVPGVLSLEIKGSANFGAFVPAVSRDYTSSLAAVATSSATAAELTVRDPSAQATGHLVNRGHALAHPIQIRGKDADTTGPYADVPESGARLRLLSFPAPYSARPLTIDFKQSIDATESLAIGGYGKTLVFTLSATTP